MIRYTLDKDDEGVGYMAEDPQGEYVEFKDVEALQRQIGYMATQLMLAGDKRSLPEIVEAAAKATSN